MTNLPAGINVQGGISHFGAVDVEDVVVVVVCRDDFDGRVSRGTKLLLSFDFGGEDGSVCERLSFDTDVMVDATADGVGIGLVYSLIKLFTKVLSARGIGSPSLTNAKNRLLRCRLSSGFCSARRLMGGAPNVMQCTRLKKPVR